MAEERPNFFVLLGLDPRKTWDQALFERELARAKNEWARLVQSGLPKVKAAAAKRYLPLYDEIRRVLGDPSKRQAESDKAKEEEIAAVKARCKDVGERLTLMLARGYLFDNEVAALRRDHGDVLASDQALARRIGEADVRPAPADTSSGRLDSELENTLARLLSEIGELSVYDVLRRVDGSISNTSPEERLLDAAYALWKKAHDTKVKSDPSLPAQERLGTIARTDLFSSAEQRRRHDKSMEIARLQTIVARYQQTLAAAGAVCAAQVTMYLEEARTDGVDDLELAKRHFVDNFARLGWIVEMPALEVEDELRRRVQCPKCAQLNDPDSAACRTCGLLLREPCPACGAVDPRYGLGCRCGFPIGQRYLVEDLVVQAKQALVEHDLDQAKIYLDRAASIWALPPDLPDPSADEIRTMRAALADALHAIQEATVSVERLMSERRYFAAVREIRNAPEGLARREALLGRAETEIENARTLFHQAKQSGIPRSRQADLYAQALRICQDFEPARTELSRMPPEPPSHCRATISDPAAGVLLNWTASPDHDVSYIVVRCTNDRVPESPDTLPGQRHAGTTAATSFRDRGAAEIVGVPLRYAVFTGRSGTFSSPSVTEPVVITVDATVEAHGEDGRVILTWSVPATAVRVEVAREEADGARPTVLTVTEPGHLTDTDVRNGVRYRYTVRTAYRRPGGGLVWTDGQVREITPVTPPAPSGPLAVTGSSPELNFADHQVRLRWPPPERGIMKVIRQRGAGVLREGDRLAETDLHGTGLVLSGLPPLTDSWIERGLTVCSYLPVAVVDGIGYVGKPRRYARADDPSDVYSESVGRRVRVHWTWPKDSTEVLVGYDATQDLFDATVAAEQTLVRRRPGDDDGSCDLPPPPGEHLHVVVATVVEQEGVRYVASGVPLLISRPKSQV